MRVKFVSKELEQARTSSIPIDEIEVGRFS
jgi:hypothetical protein